MIIKDMQVMADEFFTDLFNPIKPLFGPFKIRGGQICRQAPELLKGVTCLKSGLRIKLSQKSSNKDPV